MTKLDQDLQYLEAGIRELQDYLLSNELYWTLAGASSLPRLTVGGLLLARTRLGGRADSFAARVDAIRLERQSAWDAKTSREVRARSDLWKNYLMDYRESPQSHVSEYPQQVRYRAMLTLLGQNVNEHDEYVRGVFIEGKFVWEPECESNFSRDSFWFLFGRLK